MNKIISINLKGVVFQVEEEAFEQLQKYLELLNRHFANEESRLEIIDDIESRIAEMMQEKLEYKTAITVDDVEEIINTMGSPSDFGIDEEEETTQQTNNEKQHANVPPMGNAPKRFMRDTENSVLGGVCAGAGHYFGIEPLWIRLGFLFLFFVLGTGLLFYIILWIIIPEAKTPSDRLQMKGEPVTVDNIEKTVKEEYERVKKNINNFSKTRKDPVAKAIYKTGNFLRDVLVAFAKFFSKVLAFFLMFLGVVLFIALVSVLIQLLIDGTLPVISLAFENVTYLWITIIAAGLLLLVTVVGLITASLTLFNPRRKLFNKSVAISTGSIAIVSFITLLTMGISFGRSFSMQQSLKNTKVLGGSDTLVVSAYNPVYEKIYGEYDASRTYDYSSVSRSRFLFRNARFNYVKTSSNAILNDSLWCIAKLEVRRSENPQWELEVIRTAYGSDEYMAQVYAEKIPLGYTLNDSLLTLNTHFYVGDNTPFRDQEITYRLWVPQGKVVKFEQGVTEIMAHRLKRKVTDPEYYGMTWAMGEKGLRCLDCKDLVQNGSYAHHYQRYNVSNFTAVEANIPVEVNIEYGEDFEVYASGPYDARQRLDIFTRGKTLKIEIDDEDLFDIFDKYDAGDMVITVKLPKLEAVEANGAARVYLASISERNLAIDIHGASRVEGDIRVDDLRLALSGSSKAVLKGSAKGAHVELSGASNYNGFDLATEVCEIEQSGAAKSELRVSVSLDAEASGASKIRYKGNPTVSNSASGAASIKKVE